MDRLIVPLNVDLTKADGRPSERINETNPTAVITTADGAAPKRMRVLPTVGPQFVATDQPHSIVEGVLRTAQSALLKRWPSLQNLLDTTSRLLGYFSSSFTHYSSLHKVCAASPPFEFCS
jgi:hypothetical protein